MSIDRRKFLGESSLLLSAGTLAAGTTAALASGRAEAQEGAVSAQAIEALQQQVQELTRRLGRMEDFKQIRELHFKYGYYIDMCLYDEAVDLFSDDSELYFLNGIFRGRAGVRRLYAEWFRDMFTDGHNGPVYGLLLDHLQFQDIIDVAPDGQSAKGRFRAILQGGQHHTKERRVPNFPDQCWEGGIYENEYVREDGVWKIRKLDYNMLWQADYEPGWANGGVHLQPLTRTYPDDPIGPDALRDEVPATWPETRVVPFHYDHPVTGERWQG